MLKSLKTSKGFTLIELLVVIAIIAILAVLIILNLNSARKKARDAQRKSDIGQIQTALESYADDNAGSFPPAGSVIFLRSGVLGQYLTKDVRDPKNTAPYVYSYSVPVAGTYRACAHLEISNTDYCVSNQ